jgi:hypothetical protein
MAINFKRAQVAVDAVVQREQHDEYDLSALTCLGSKLSHLKNGFVKFC